MGMTWSYQYGVWWWTFYVIHTQVWFAYTGGKERMEWLKWNENDRRCRTIAHMMYEIHVIALAHLPKKRWDCVQSISFGHSFRISMVIWATTWQNQQCECAPSEDSDQPGHPPSLIRVFAVRSMGSPGPKLSSCGQRRLRSDWADAQAYLSLRWAHSHFVSFVMSRLNYGVDEYK